MHIQKLLANSILGRGFYYVAVLAVTIFLSRYLRASEAGVFFYTLLILSFFVLILSCSFDAAITFYVAKHQAEHWLKALIPVWSFAAGLIGVILVNACFNFLNLTAFVMPFQFSVFVFLFISGQCLINFSSAWLQANHSFFWPYAVQALSNLGFLLTGFWLIQVGKGSDQMFTAYFCFILLSGILLYSILLKQKQTSTKSASQKQYSRKHFFMYAFTALWANILFFLVYRMDAWFLKQSDNCTAADLGNYLQASKLGQMMLILPQVAASVVFPQTAKKQADTALLHSITTITRLMSIFFMLLFIITALTGDIVFPFVFGSSFSGITVPFLILIPGIFFLSVHTVLAAWLGGSGHVKQNLISAGIALTLAGIGYYFTVPIYGIIAAASVSSFAYLILMCYSFFVIRRHVSISFLDSIGYKKDDFAWLFTLLKKQRPVNDLTSLTQNTANE